jgi:hypothetical protein
VTTGEGKIAGDEYITFQNEPHKNVTLMVQVPSTFNPSKGPNEDKGKKERPRRSVSEGPTFRLPAGLDRAAGSLAMTRVPNVFHGHNRKCERYSHGKTSSGIKTLR